MIDLIVVNYMLVSIDLIYSGRMLFINLALLKATPRIELALK